MLMKHLRWVSTLPGLDHEQGRGSGRMDGEPREPPVDRPWLAGFPTMGIAAVCTQRADALDGGDETAEDGPDVVDDEVVGVCLLGCKTEWFPRGLIKTGDVLLVRKLLPDPDVNVEIINDYRLVDIAADRFDGGVRFGGHVDKDMIAMRLSSGFRTAIVAAPAYFENRRLPKVPQDLVDHDCIGLRLPTHGGLYAWDFRKGGHTLEVRIHGRVVFNSVPMMGQAALDGMGLAYMPEDYVEEHVRDGRLVRVLEDWCPPMPGYHLYYTSRRQPSPAFALVIDALRYRA